MHRFRFHQPNSRADTTYGQEKNINWWSRHSFGIIVVYARIVEKFGFSNVSLTVFFLEKWRIPLVVLSSLKLKSSSLLLEPFESDKVGYLSPNLKLCFRSIQISPFRNRPKPCPHVDLHQQGEIFGGEVVEWRVLIPLFRLYSTE